MRGLTVMLLVVLACGCCSRLKVRKIPRQCRIAGSDTQIKGFRYYLSRPYVIVKRPILVSETVEQVLAERPSVTGDLAACGGPSRGQVIDPRRVGTRIINRAGTTRLTAAEAASLRHLVEQQTRDMPATADVQPVSFDARTAGAPPTATMDNLPSGAGRPLTVPDPDRYFFGGANTGTAPLAGDIQIVFLPDLDEQYAVHNTNILAKSAFRLRFLGGWQLTDVGAEHDSTTVAIELLNLIDRAVDAAKTVSSARIERTAKLAKSGGTMDETAIGMEIDGRPVYQRVHSTYIRPGIYRLNKPWEMGQQPLQGQGLLVQLGLDMMVFTQIRQPAGLGAVPPDTAADASGDGPRTPPHNRRVRPGQPIRLPEVIGATR